MSKRNRRQFLQESMLAAAAASVPAGVLLAEEEKQGTSASERLAVAVVGVRGRGMSHVGAFAGRKDTEITYVCDADRDIGESRCKEIGKRQGREPVFVQDLRKVLEDKSVDIVSIATPNHLHSLQAIWSIQAGKDVYVEKPVSHNVSEGRRVVEAARKYGKICQTGTQSRSNPGMIEAIKYVHDGNLGKLLVARGLCYKSRPSIGPKGDYPVPANVNYDLWLGPAPMAPVTRKQFHYDWHWQWAYGNGDLGNQGIHQMDLARWGLGTKDLCKSVASYGGRFGYVDAGETANTQVVVHDYGDKSLVFEVRGLKTPNFKGAGVGVIFEGTEGYVAITSYSGGTAFDKAGNKIRDFSGSAGEEGHFANFLKAVRSRKHTDLNADIEEGHISSALCHLGNISYRLGSEVVAKDSLMALSMLKTTDNVADTLERTLSHLSDNGVDLAATRMQIGPTLAFDSMSERFPGNEQADKMLTRVYRKGFVVPEAGQV